MYSRNGIPIEVGLQADTSLATGDLGAQALCLSVTFALLSAFAKPYHRTEFCYEEDLVL